MYLPCILQSFGAWIEGYCWTSIATKSRARIHNHQELEIHEKPCAAVVFRTLLMLLRGLAGRRKRYIKDV